MVHICKDCKYQSEEDLLMGGIIENEMTFS